ncbi:MAG: EamA family transporter [Betaproteobacteria bacterium]|nr:MAG: EamA family transporter [Betaproteobacteria bacterium]
MTPTHPTSLRFELLLLGVLACLWGSSYLLIKVALGSIPPTTLMAFRVALAALFLLAVMRFRGERLPTDSLSWRRLFVQSLLNSSLAWLVLAWGAQYVPSGLAGVLNSTSPLFVFLITALMGANGNHSITKSVGVALGFVGVVLVVGVDALQGFGQQALAQAAVLFGAFLYACAALNGKRLAHLSPLVTATGTMLWAALTLVPLSIVIDQPWTIRPSLNAMLAATTLSLLCTGVALIVYFRLIKTLGPMGVASQSYLRAGISVLLGLVVLGEQLSPTVLMGLVIIIAGVAMINVPQKKTPSTQLKP